MTSYTVCARTGCDKRVAYNVHKDVVRHRYCDCCEKEIAGRLIRSKQCSDADFVNALIMRVVKE